MGHLHRWDVVQLGLHGPLSTTDEHPHAAAYAAAEFSRAFHHAIVPAIHPIHLEGNPEAGDYARHEGQLGGLGSESVPGQRYGWMPERNGGEGSGDRRAHLYWRRGLRDARRLLE